MCATPQLSVDSERPRDCTRRTVANLVNVVGGEALLRVANFAAGVLIARQGGAATFGFYASALAYSTISTMIADNGLQVEAVKQISSAPSYVAEIASRLYVTKTAVFAGMLLVVAAVASFAHLPHIAWVLGSVIIGRTILQSYCQMQIGMLKALDRMSFIGGIQSAHFVLLAGGMLYVYLRAAGVTVVLGFLVAGQMFELVLEALVLRRAGTRFVSVSFRDCYSLMRGSTSIGLSFGIANAILRTDLIVLSFFATTAAVGKFAAAQTVVIVVYVVAWLFGSVLLPDMVRMGGELGAVDEYVRRWTRTVLALLIPVTLLGIVAGPFSMRFLYGRAFDSSGQLLSVSICAAPFIVLNSLYFNKFIALGMARICLWLYIAVAALTLGLDVGLCHLMGAAGIAAAIVLREAAMLFGFLIFANAGKTRHQLQELGCKS